ncbi:hypothetical protein PM082_012077 [Marasmius tenuissimus]|nr:hypothetical protein PM082_012077 [Marasmius tenuissimus]
MIPHSSPLFPAYSIHSNVLKSIKVLQYPSGWRDHSIELGNSTVCRNFNLPPQSLCLTDAASPTIWFLVLGGTTGTDKVGGESSWQQGRDERREGAVEYGPVGYTPGRLFSSTVISDNQN